VRRLKLDTTIATPKLNQHILAQFLTSGAYDRHLRKLRNALKNQVSNMALAVARYFPEGTQITSPKGGLLLWVQLIKAFDGLEIYHRAIKENISILPGVVCSVNNRYRNCLRLSCGYPWSHRVEDGIIKLAEIIDKLS
jgi:DNA-binding transcriptional MocR family regulator